MFLIHRLKQRNFFVLRGNEDSLYGSKFIANDKDVQVHMKVLYDKMGSQVSFYQLRH